jgi:uncharacterized membrane protein
MKIKNKILGINILVLLTVSLVFGSCQWLTVEPVVVEVPDVVNFSEIQAIFSSKCIGCHGGASPSAGLDLTAGNAYNNLISKNLVNTANPEQSRLYVHITAPSDHSGPEFTATESALVLKWIQDGAHN